MSNCPSLLENSLQPSSLFNKLLFYSESKFMSIFTRIRDSFFVCLFCSFLIAPDARPALPSASRCLHSVQKICLYRTVKRATQLTTLTAVLPMLSALTPTTGWMTAATTSSLRGRKSLWTTPTLPRLLMACQRETELWASPRLSWMPGRILMR